MEVKLTIERAAGATEVIQEHVGSALRILHENFDGRIVNGWGVYADPSNQRHHLRAAIEALTKAQAAMDATTWPTAVQYEGAE
ncbi:hypothetical protein [Plastoroseomonas hellenica]|uniref:WXG100 family type VII secretion target n=1 Tax=Plastoroseomonas hellenica TaxID=2687306 RepID=A0ABS5EWN6_9PROT|nr:hypothetical protein [Plastoroseomonas hellenica]MBR0641240.1 hypothetical protein [Plastoroseomonas hellenica]MBR0664707.1 hypothetical protein [Plastoroseomonas hellenica]